MAAGKIKITVDNLEDSQGVVVDEEKKEEITKKKKSKVTVKKKTVKKEKEEPAKEKKKGRPAKKKTSISVKSEDDDRIDEKIEEAGNFMSKINISASEKQEVMDELEKRVDKKEKELVEENNDPEEDSDDVLKFSSLKEKNFDEEEEIDHHNEDDEIGAKRSIGIYRKIAIFFLIATVSLLVFVSYFLFSSVTITIIPDQERINNNMIIDIYDKDSEGAIEGEKIAGIVKKTSMDLTKKYETTGEDVIGEEVAGEVTIYNYYTKNQPLVATTRLMSPDGRVYRIEETVNVPAGGKVTVRVYADEPSVNMEIGPTKFTIPGLWAGIQDKIYGESKSKIEYSQKVNKFVTQADIDNAIRDLKQELVKKAKTEINKKYKDYSQVIYSIDDNSVFTEIDTERGEKVDDFEATITANIVAVAFDGKAAANLSEKKFISTLPAGKELIEFNRDNIIYTLDSFDYKEGTASVNSTFEGKVSLGADSDVINKESILGLNKSQLDAYLMSKDGISGYDIKFFPSFIKKVPKVPDKIIIKTKR